MVNTCCCRGQALLQELLQEIVLRNSATQRGSINKKISINDFRIEKSIYKSYTKPRFWKNRRDYEKWSIQCFFSKIMNDKVGTEAKMDIYFIKNVSSLWPLFQQYEKTTWNNICRQIVKWSNIVLFLIT